MQILILGATGRTGKQLLQQALHKGYTVHALVRDKSRVSLANSRLILFEGTPTDLVALEQAMQGCEAVLSVLNISRASDFPWAGLRTPKDFLSDSMNKVIAVCNNINCERIIVVTAWGVNESKKELPGWFRWVIDHSNVKYPYLDHGVVENLLKASSLDWTIVRPVKVSFNGDPKPGYTISRRNVAKFMLDALENRSFLRQSPTVSS
jgi:putative NADH-flavin reductase